MFAELKPLNADVHLHPEGKGIFDVRLNGMLLYSKYQMGRFPADGEVLALIKNTNDAS